MVTKSRGLRHGMSNSPEYRSWGMMIQRCCNPSFSNYQRWGGLGVTVAPEWRDFRRFLADMGLRPPGTSLDRIRGDEGYHPGNCRWATSYQQQRNLRTNIWVEIDGVRKCLKDWCTTLGLNYDTIYTRVKRGWEPHTALTTIVKSKGCQE